MLHKILKWFMPYKYYNLSDSKSKDFEKKENLQKIKRGQLGIKIITVKHPLTLEEVEKTLSKIESHKALYCHDNRHHQMAVKFEKGSALTYQFRDGVKRKKLKPLLYPNIKKSYDRTHIIPVGFHGSESDNRLLVGWDSSMNRGSINEFEMKVKKINEEQAIKWFVDIHLNYDKTVTWKAYVWDEKGRLIKSEQWHDKSKFTWLK